MILQVVGNFKDLWIRFRSGKNATKKGGPPQKTVITLVFQSYLLRFGVWMVCFWGPNASSPGVWKPRVSGVIVTLINGRKQMGFTGVIIPILTRVSMEVLVTS